MTIRVLHSLAPPDGSTKFVDQMTQGAPSDVEVVYFTWRTALLGRYDVLHLHWPELLLRGRTRRKRIMKRAAARALLLRLRLTRTPAVRTLHNLDPHEDGDPPEVALLRRMDRATTLFIRLNPTTPAPSSARAGAPVRTILHGHYRGVFAAHPREDAEPELLLYFGIIRPYKNVEHLIDVFGSLPPGRRLRVVGSPSPSLRAQIAAAIERTAGVSGRLEFVADEDLVEEVSRASLVVLPYAEMHNSGAMLVALSLDRPVLAPRTSANEALSAEVGGSWLMLYEGALTADLLEEAHAATPTILAGPRPLLDGRDWDVIGTQHRAAYREAMGIARRGEAP